jgi:hypothetical protein
LFPFAKKGDVVGCDHAVDEREDPEEFDRDAPMPTESTRRARSALAARSAASARKGIG